MREARLGDVIDDYCVKCKQIMNHSVVSIVEAAPAINHGELPQWSCP